MKSIFLCDDKSNINRVYHNNAIRNLVDTAELDTNVYSKNDIITAPQKFKDVEYIFSTWGMPVFTKEEVADCFPALKCLFYAAGTVRFFANAFLENNVRIFNAAVANAIPVAETAAAQIVLANKGFFQTSRVYKKQLHAQSCKVLENCAGNYDTNVGIIGVGMIGKRLVGLLKNYQLNIYAYDPFLPDKTADELGIVKCDLPTLFKTCFTVSNHLADNEQTRGMLTGDLFLSMPQNATFINTGRGAQVVENELIDALEKRPDLTAILDVTYPEPVNSGSKFFSLENCILTPHIAGSQQKEVHRMADCMVQEYNNYIQGEKPQYEVTLDALKTMA